MATLALLLPCPIKGENYLNASFELKLFLSFNDQNPCAH